MSNERTHEEASADMFRRDPEFAADYLNYVLAEGDSYDMEMALHFLTKAYGEEADTGQIPVEAKALHHLLGLLKVGGMCLSVERSNPRIAG
jgi:hypothetical protein